MCQADVYFDARDIVQWFGIGKFDWKGVCLASVVYAMLPLTIQYSRNRFFKPSPCSRCAGSADTSCNALKRVPCRCMPDIEYNRCMWSKKRRCRSSWCRLIVLIPCISRWPEAVHSSIHTRANVYEVESVDCGQHERFGLKRRNSPNVLDICPFPFGGLMPGFSFIWADFSGSFFLRGLRKYKWRGRFRFGNITCPFLRTRKSRLVIVSNYWQWPVIWDILSAFERFGMLV